MLCVPAIRARVVVRECCGVTLDGCVGGTHDRLSHVAEAVDHVPVVIIWDLVARFESRVRLYDGP